MAGWERTVIKGPAGQWKMCRAPWIPTDFCLGIFVGCSSCLELWMQSFPARCEAGGHRPSSSAPVGPFPCTVLGCGVVSLALGPLFFPIALTAPRAASASCYIMLLFSTCDSIRNLLSFFFSFHCALILALNLPTVWKGWRETSLKV